MKRQAASPVTHSPLVVNKIATILAAIGGSLPRHPDAKAKLERLLTGLAGIAFEAGRNFERRQLDAALADIPAEAREAHARGLWQGREAVERAQSLQGALDAIDMIAIQIAPAHLRQARPAHIGVDHASGPDREAVHVTGPQGRKGDCPPAPVRGTDRTDVREDGNK